MESSRASTPSRVTEKEAGELQITQDHDLSAIEKNEPQPPSNSANTDIPPEEGLRGWLCVLGASLTLFCSFGFLNAIGVFQSYYQEHQLKDYSPSTIAWIFTVQLALMWAPGPLFGRLTDTFGPAPVLYPCGVLCVFSLCMTSLCTEYYQIFLAQGLGFGLGAGGLFTCSFICVGQWFVARRGLAVGLAAAGSSLGGVIFPLFVSELVADVGFDGAIRYTALLVGVLLLAAVFLVRARLPRKRWDWRAKWFEPSLFREPHFAFYTFGACLVVWGLWVPLDFVSSFAAQQGFPPLLAVALISVINAASIFGRILPPYVADKVGHFNVVNVTAFATGLSILCLWLPFGFHRSVAGVVVFCLVYGFGSGSFVSLLMPCVAKTGPIETIGMRFGTFQLAISLACLTGLPIAGAVLARQDDTTYWGQQTFAVVAVFLGATLMSVSTLLLRKMYGTWKV